MIKLENKNAPVFPLNKGGKGVVYKIAQELGIYFVKIETSEGIVVKKFVKQ